MVQGQLLVMIVEVSVFDNIRPLIQGLLSSIVSTIRVKTLLIAGFISIIWDNGHQCQYPYGIQGRFAVIVVDEPRILQRDQLIEVGCLVKRGTKVYKFQSTGQYVDTR